MISILRQHAKNSSGFALSELLVVIAIIGIMSAIAAPSLLRSLPEKRLKNAARNLYADMQRARLLAVKENRKVYLRVNITDNFYYFDDDKIEGYTAGQFRRDLSEYGDVNFGFGKATKKWDGDSLPSYTAKDRIFNATGTTEPVSGSFYLENKNKDVCYAVTVTNYGAVRIRRFNGTKWDEKD